MFRGLEKKKSYTLERIWFATTDVSSEADIIRYLRIEQPQKVFFSQSQSLETVITDLTKPIDDILSSATKTVRYEVNKCEKEDVAISFFTAEELKDNEAIVNEFETAYLDFAKTINVKMVDDAYSRSKILNEIDCGTILLSKAEKDGVDVYHVYFCGDKETCLCYSVSNYRDDSTKRNLAGRMNKLLHVKDMEWFKSRNYKVYDWGNISSSENPNGIDKFKMSFGGKVVTLYNSFVGNTLKGKLLVLGYKLKGR